MALSQLQRDAGSVNMLSISYHYKTTDTFYTADAASRATYYSVVGTPTTWADGDTVQVGTKGSVRDDSLAFAGFYNRRRGITSQLSITLNGIYDRLSRAGRVKIMVTNTGSSPILNHKLRYVIVETVPYRWYTLDTCWEVCRKMLPNADGVNITLAPGETKPDSQNFTLGSGWVDAKALVVSFVQSDSTKEILQGAWTPLLSFSAVEEQSDQWSTVKGQGLRITPNPVVSFATVPGHEHEPFVLYDISGRRVGTYQGDRIGEGLKAGVYFLKPMSESAESVRIVKLR